MDVIFCCGAVLAGDLVLALDGALESLVVAKHERHLGVVLVHGARETGGEGFGLVERVVAQMP